MKPVKSILVIRFRQMGDMILATAMINALKETYPEATVDVVLNERIAPLFQHHKSIDNILAFSDDERHNFLQYLTKVWKVVHAKHYDVIIDMRSTVNTLPFTLFSLGSRYRMGIRKPYTPLLFNHRVGGCKSDESMLDHNFKLIQPLLPDNGKRTGHSKFTIDITEAEKDEFAKQMAEKGIDFTRPIMIAGVTAKLPEKTWDKRRMAETLSLFHKEFPDCQIIFNYAPGREEDNALEIHRMLDTDKDILIDIQAKSPRELAAMASLSTFYFGNEGGARHIVQAMGKPSFVICSPMASKKTWLPEDEKIPTEGISPADIIAADRLPEMDAAARYDAITVERVWQRLLPFCKKLGI